MATSPLRKLLDAMTTTRNLSTPFCVVLLSSSLLICIEPVLTNVTLSNPGRACIRQHERTLTLREKFDTTFRVERRLTTAIVTKKTTVTHPWNNIVAWVVQNIGGSELMLYISPRDYMRFTCNKEASAFKLFQKYGVGSVMTNMFASEAFKRWAGDLDTAFPGEPDFTAKLMVSAMATHDEGKLIDSIGIAKAVSETSAIGRKLESALVDRWLSKPRKLIEVLKDPMVQKWYATLHEGDSAKDVFVFKSYARKEFEEREVDFEAELETAAEAAGDDVSTMATSILGIKRADDEFRRLALDKATSSEAIMMHDNFPAWLEKVRELGWNPVKLLLPKLKAVSSEKQILVDCFSANHLPDELRGDLQDAVFDQWAGKSGSVVLKDLKLDVAGEELFLHALILSWADYVWRLYPYTAPTEMLKMLWVHYKHNLLKLIAQAQESSEEPVKALARDLAKAVNEHVADDLPEPVVPPPVAPLPDV